MAVARSCSGGVAALYTSGFVNMSAYFYVMALWCVMYISRRHIEYDRRNKVSLNYKDRILVSCAVGAKSVVYDRLTRLVVGLLYNFN